MSRFNVGDIVEGLGRPGIDYAITGRGSICTVLCSYGDGTEILVQTIPMDASGPFRVYSECFKFKEPKGDIKPMPTPKIEEIKLYRCQQDIKGMGSCDEIAEVRLTIPGLSVTLCHAHGLPYKNGEKEFKAIQCSGCKGVCKPGYFRDDQYGESWCNEDCRAAYHLRNSGVTAGTYAAGSRVSF